MTQQVKTVKESLDEVLVRTVFNLSRHKYNSCYSSHSYEEEIREHESKLAVLVEVYRLSNQPLPELFFYNDWPINPYEYEA